MIEVFKTNVGDGETANMLIEKIQLQFKNIRANFDLHDCDKILRVESLKGEVQSVRLIKLLNESGFQAEILQD